MLTLEQENYLRMALNNIQGEAIKDCSCGVMDSSAEFEAAYREAIELVKSFFKCRCGKELSKGQCRVCDNDA
jgi:hypothetical protein